MEPVIEFRSDRSATVIYACPQCRLTHGKDKASAAACCVCRQCGRPVDKQHHLLCETCEGIDRIERENKRLAKLRELPIVEDDGGPVYVEDTSRWYENSDVAAEALYDDEKDPTTAIVFPSTVSTAPVPSLQDYVSEAWSELYEDGYYDDLPKGAADVLAACETALLAHAPTLWSIRPKQRIVLPAVSVSPEAIRPANTEMRTSQ